MESKKEVEELLAAWSDGTLSEHEADELRRRLRDSEAARAEFVQWQMLETALHLEASAGGEMLPSTSLDLPATLPKAATSSHMSNRLLWAVVASVAFACVIARWAYLEAQSAPSGTGQTEVASVEATAQGIAMVTRTVDARWQAGDRQAGDRIVEVGDALRPGKLKLDSGYAQIEFFCGASIVLEGPAELELVSATSARFLHGRLRAQVPPAARNFQIDVQGMKVVDLGTEFGLSVSPSGTDVQVFDGEVELHRPESQTQLVRMGEAVKHENGELRKTQITPTEFIDLAALDSQARDQTTQRYERWKAYSDQLRQDDRLIAYYAINDTDRWQRKLKNSTSGKDLDGAIVGARRVAGRWAAKGGLEFKQPGDRVRVKIPGEFHSLTFACWVKIDSLDRWYNSLFLTDNYQQGEPHWQILDTGQLFFSVRPDPKRAKLHKIVLSPPFWIPSMSGKWLHLATTYDVQAKRTTHYLNGEPLHAESIPDGKLESTTRIGMASIGNWSVPTKPEEHFAIRNLNGSFDEFMIFGAALSADEIKTMYENGKP